MTGHRFVASFVLALWMGSGAMGCGSSAPGPDPDGTCVTDDECTAATPVCGIDGHCTRECTADAECADLADRSVCDRVTGECSGPCTENALRQYVCDGGVRRYCSEDASLPCETCGCTPGSFCGATTCEPLREGGEVCGAHQQCLSAACTPAARCSVQQGEECTDSICDGVCAARPDGTTHCIRPQCPSDCDERTDGGLEWTCAHYETYEACVPVESCTWESPCSTFVDATCGQSCSATCWTYCVPNAISTDD